MSSSQQVQELISLWRTNHQFNAECRCNYHPKKYVRRVNVGMYFRKEFQNRTIRIKAMSALRYRICMCLCHCAITERNFELTSIEVGVASRLLLCTSLCMDISSWTHNQNAIYILLLKVLHVELYFCLGFVYIFTHFRNNFQAFKKLNFNWKHFRFCHLPCP